MDYELIYGKLMRENLPYLKCAKCSSNENISIFSLKFTSIQTHIERDPWEVFEKNEINVPIPACVKCKGEFLSWKKNFDLFNNMIKLSGCFIIGLILLIAALLFLIETPSVLIFNWEIDGNVFKIIFIIGIIILIIILLGANFYSRFKMKKLVKHERSPSNYISLSNLKYNVKPLGTSDWIPIDDWINSNKAENKRLLIENNQTSILCGKCGSKNPKDSNFCEKCGNSLKIN